MFSLQLNIDPDKLLEASDKAQKSKKSKKKGKTKAKGKQSKSAS